MGQLEKYGLYVLCLVIFLILGVTIWGGSDVAAPGQKTPPVAMHAGPSGAGVGALGDGRPVNQTRNPERLAASNALADGAGAGGGNNFLESLLRPAPTPVGPGVSGGSPTEGDRKVDGQPSDATTGPERAAPPPAEPRTYTVAAGDTFDSIARQQLGNASLRTEIQKLNPKVDPRRLKVGMQVRLPAASSQPSTDATSTAGAAPDGRAVLRRAGAYRTYTIGKGDNFERIARVELGSIKRVDELKQLNPDVDPRRLGIGKKIKLPID